MPPVRVSTAVDRLVGRMSSLTDLDDESDFIGVDDEDRFSEPEIDVALN